MSHFLILLYVVFFIICSSNNAVVVQGFTTAPSKSQSKATQQQNQNDAVITSSSSSNSSKDPKQHIATTHSFSVPLSNPRPKPQSFTDKFKELWNDPRPISAVLTDTDSSSVGRIGNTDIPYCIVSDKINIDNNEEAFQILLYPRGRFVGSDDATTTTSSSSSITGSASAYLRYLPKQYGDEVDIAWKLRLCTIDNDEPLSIITSGGLPKSNTTWSAAMTLCVELESSESVGRAQDWGSSTWSANEVCNALGNLKAEGEITIFEKRHGESSFAFPPKGAVGAVLSAVQLTSSNSANGGRVFRAGEVIVPRNTPGFEKDVDALRKQFIYPGVDYRIMSMTDKDGLPIFSTDSIDNNEDRRKVRLALRPCGWKLQQQLWKRDGVTDWPIEVEAGALSTVATTRFNINSAIPRITSAFQRDWKLYTLSLAIALTPIPLALVARSFISFYVIPSASMEPTLLRGDLLVVEKIDTRTKRGDVVLFQPPDSLRDIITNNGSQLSSTSLFVKRVVGLPGDNNIFLDDDGNVQINGKSAVGPDRSLCTDEPLRLIDKQLRDGKGKELRELGPSDVYVLGDCKAVSVDSRVWGALPKEKIKGRPIARIWPLSRFKLTLDGQL
jgi:signal peptidase I